MGLVNVIIALVCAPFLISLINKTKAYFAGRQGPMWLQPYYDLWKLLHKGAVYSRTTSWIFQAGPMIVLACMFTALLLTPLGQVPALLAFPGDIIVFAYVLALARFALILMALDTGSAFEGMGASREAIFSTLTEPALILGLAAVAHETHKLSLTEMHLAANFSTWTNSILVLAIVTSSLLIVFLAENARIPVDDPETHLELTMIHEVMILDNSGPDLAYLQYAQALKIWVLGSLLQALFLPGGVNLGIPILDIPLSWIVHLLGLAVLTVGTGVVESGMARLRMPRVPQLLLGATALSALALVLGKWSP